MAVFLGEAQEVLVAQTEVESQPGRCPPVVLRKTGVNPCAQVVAADAEALGGHVRQTQQEVGKVKPGARDRPATSSEVARAEARKVKSTARVGVGQGVELNT